MKLRRIKIAGFRGFAEECEVDLDADVILISGPNGSGKTSLFDSVLWALTGQVERLGGDENLVSRYSQFGEARVELSLSDGDGAPVEIVRRYDGKQSLLVHHGDSQVSGPTAEAALLELLWPEAKVAQDPRASLSRSITRAVYLQQDQVRSFLDADDEQSRFDIVSEIVGSGRVSDLVRQLESARRAWTSATNRQKEELERLVRRRNALREQTERLSARAGDLEALDERWSHWWSGSGRELASGQDRSMALEQQLDQLRANQRRLEDRLSRLGELADILSDPPPQVSEDEVSTVNDEVATARDRFDNVTYALSAAQSQAAAAREQMVSTQENRDSLAALANLALRHLGDVCPVCTQSFDEGVTRAHLTALLNSEVPSDRSAEEYVLQASSAVRTAEDDLADCESRLKEIERRRRTWSEWQESVRIKLRELDLDSASIDVNLVDRHRAASENELALLVERRRAGESLLVELAEAAEFEHLSEIRSQYDHVAGQCQEGGAEVLARDLAANDAKSFHDSLREVSESLVTTELQRMEPLLQRIYASVDPHPSFRAVSFLTETRRGRGHLWTSLSDSQEDRRVNDPSILLSSSQMNVLAVVVFLALNLSVPSLPLQTVILDDPLQSLDDVNLLGLSDLLRRLRRGRQVILSTHDDRLAGLLERKLRPVGDEQRTVALRIDGWARSGPTITSREVPRDSPDLRLATA